ncbi:hypothetical protein IVB22_18500 [Bradyrhizobium sp. 190]|uniref:hypothetical protein n=1 Tax=Bradyrhizobium sp. 190 TaxID=2782658 RepID=UPI001FF8FCD0|nr:hypothetical protein [Bradyrhizobium sp. 190]MCK1514523.1 hypothetical protein [Bradyrhizobium sp. 190]
MSAGFDRDALLDAFDRIGRAAAQAGTKLQIAIYDGSALMLASNFRFATEDVDVSKLDRPWFTAADPSDAMREYLTFSSPAEFASRNIFTEERPLRRARGPYPSRQ